jgi:hypothetical protein
VGYADLGAYLDDDAIDTPPIPSRAHPEGKPYRIESPDAATGIRLTALVSLGVDLAVGAQLSQKDAERLRMDDDQERDFLRDVLGATYDQMLEDGVSWVRIQRLGRYALLYFTLGPEAAAEETRRATSAGEAQAPNRQARRAAAKASSRASSATATSSKARGSTAGTTSRRARPAAQAG